MNEGRPQEHAIYGRSNREIREITRNGNIRVVRAGSALLLATLRVALQFFAHPPAIPNSTADLTDNTDKDDNSR
ncbi:MAG: hypothetical protein Ta2A_02470 [Treponemataceae bacterium]|nr:MAG: hypothetical protein Ta2A_02470 [Treponemataceae bacterium]